MSKVTDKRVPKVKDERAQWRKVELLVDESLWRVLGELADYYGVDSTYSYVGTLLQQHAIAEIALIQGAHVQKALCLAAGTVVAA